MLNLANMAVAEAMQCCFWLETREIGERSDKVQRLHEESNSSRSTDITRYISARRSLLAQPCVGALHN